MVLLVREQRVIHMLAEEINSRSPTEHREMRAATVAVLHSKNNDSCNKTIADNVVGAAPDVMYSFFKLALSDIVFNVLHIDSLLINHYCSIS